MRDKDFRIIELDQFIACLLFGLWMFTETDLNIKLTAGGAVLGPIVCFTGTVIYEFMIIASKHN